MPPLPLFPNFNIYSSPLLILVLQGYIFAGLLLYRYAKQRQLADVLLACLLIITGYNRTSYIIGFMGWYDVFENTKINYALLDFSFIVGPLLFFYIKSLTKPEFRFKKADFWHFIPALVIIIFELFVWIYDAQQPGFSDVQNGIFHESIVFKYVHPFTDELSTMSQLIYLAFAIDLFLKYKNKIVQYFSNTYKVELNWIRNFLIAYTSLFSLYFFMNILNEITPLHWTQNWWSHFAGALVMIYVGMMGYFTNLKSLYALTFEIKKNKAPLPDAPSSVYDDLKTALTTFMRTHRPYLNAELTLSELAKLMNIPTSQLSQAINIGFNKNFKDFINEYRVEAVKKMLLDGSSENFTLLSIAYDCGFNSKATFNRTFKKFTSITPTEYLKSHHLA